MRPHIILATTIALIMASVLLLATPTPTSHLTQSSGMPVISSDNDILQLVFQGLFAENNLAGPYMVKYCFDEPTSHRIVVFIGEALEKAARGNVADLLKLI